jgi:hypothetical protein
VVGTYNVNAARNAFKSAFESEDTFAVTLVALMTDRFGTEWFDWRPETVRLNLEDVGVSPHALAFNRLMAGATIVKTDAFAASVPTFIGVCNTLAGSVPIPELFDPADATECAWGLTEASLLLPELDGLSDDVRVFVTLACEQEGLVHTPKALKPYVQLRPVNLPETQDPVLFAGSYEIQQALTDSVDDAVAQALAQLRGQLEGIFLENGDTAHMLKEIDRMRQRLTVS